MLKLPVERIRGVTLSPELYRILSPAGGPVSTGSTGRSRKASAQLHFSFPTEGPDLQCIYDVEVDSLEQGVGQSVADWQLLFTPSCYPARYILKHDLVPLDKYPYFKEEAAAFSLRVRGHDNQAFSYFMPIKHASSTPLVMDAVWRLGNGDLVIDRPDSHIHPGLHELVAEALDRIPESYKLGPIVVDFGREIDVSCLQQVWGREEVEVARLYGRCVGDLRRFVYQGEPLDPCRSLVVVLGPAAVGTGAKHQLISVYQHNPLDAALREWCAYDLERYLPLIDPDSRQLPTALVPLEEQD